MGKGKNKSYRVVCAYDTETTTIREGSDSRAFACLYIFNDLRGIDDFHHYVPGKSDNIKFMRTADEAVKFVLDLLQWGMDNDVIPIIAAYNLSFDLQTIQAKLAYAVDDAFDIVVNAQSSSNIYTYDLSFQDQTVLRFWDTFFFDMRGLAKMGETAGLPKAVGDWDYSLVRNPSTPLTGKELFYAGRDTQVIPAYLKYLLDSNEWMDSSDLGVKVLTKTSIVRQMAKHVIASKKVTKANGKKLTLDKAFQSLCASEFPATYQSYALRKACFRGGLTFTAGLMAGTVVSRVVSLDVTSMHHTFITGSRVPVHFIDGNPKTLTSMAKTMMRLPILYVMDNYDEPFWYGLHVLVDFKNIRLKSGSVFDKYGIAILAEGKFADKSLNDDWDNERAHMAQDSVTGRGWHDYAAGAEFAFGKLYSADHARCFLTEIELWCVAQVYDFDSMEVVRGEYTTHFIVPPDYVTLQTNILFDMKNDAKHINNTYKEGEPYTEEIPDSIPEGIANHLRDGSMSSQSFEAWYIGNVKGMFNSIYGTQAQDLLKPEYHAAADGSIHVDAASVVTPDNFADKVPDKIRVFYNYGMRIVGRSRMHLVIAMMLIYEALGDKARILGGDTDSMKISLDEDVDADDLIVALKPLHVGTRAAIEKVQYRVRKLFPKLASNLDDVGCFDIEKADKKKGIIYYDKHYEAWNKARVSMVDGQAHITCAGLSRPEDEYNVENLIDDLCRSGHSFDEIASLVLGYNTTFDNSVCHALGRTQPKVTDMFDEDVTDYLGNTEHVTAPMAIALYDTDRTVGDDIKYTNACNISYLKKHGRSVYDKPHKVCYDGHPYVEIGDPIPKEIIE